MINSELTSGFRTVSKSFKLWWDDWANQVLVSLLAVLLSLTIILLPASLMGIFYETNQLINGTKTGFVGFWIGFKSHFLKSLAWGVVCFAGIFFTVINLWFYINIKASWAYLLVGFTIILGSIFFLVQFYTPGFFTMNDDKSLIGAWKRSFAFIFSYPVHVIVIGFVALLLSIFTIVLILPLLIGFPPLVSLISLISIRSMQSQVSQTTN